MQKVHDTCLHVYLWFLYRIEIDENTSLQHSLEKAYDDTARGKRDLEQAQREAQQLRAEIEALKVKLATNK